MSKWRIEHECTNTITITDGERKLEICSDEMDSPPEDFEFAAKVVEALNKHGV